MHMLLLYDVSRPFLRFLRDHCTGSLPVHMAYSCWFVLWFTQLFDNFKRKTLQYTILRNCSIHTFTYIFEVNVTFQQHFSLVAELFFHSFKSFTCSLSQFVYTAIEVVFSPDIKLEVNPVLSLQFSHEHCVPRQCTCVQLVGVTVRQEPLLSFREYGLAYQVEELLVWLIAADAHGWNLSLRKLIYIQFGSGLFWICSRGLIWRFSPRKDPHIVVLYLSAAWNGLTPARLQHG